MTHGSSGEGGGDHRPAGDLQERAARDRDREVGPDPEPLRPSPRRERVDEREDEAAEEEEEASGAPGAGARRRAASPSRGGTTTNQTGTIART